MTLKLSKIEIRSRFKHLNIQEITDNGIYTRRILTPDMTLADDEHQKIKDKAEELWTDEVKTAWTKHQKDALSQLNLKE